MRHGPFGALDCAFLAGSDPDQLHLANPYYNGAVTFSMPVQLCRWLTLLMAGLLTLSPFLHGHFGNSHESGFHLDGVHAVHAAAKAAGHALVKYMTAADQEESLAMGVAVSLPQPSDHGLPVALAGLLLAILFLALPHLLPNPKVLWLRARLRKLYNAGFPPPCLAPPAT